MAKSLIEVSVHCGAVTSNDSVVRRVLTMFLLVRSKNFNVSGRCYRKREITPRDANLVIGEFAELERTIAIRQSLIDFISEALEPYASLAGGDADSTYGASSFIFRDVNCSGSLPRRQSLVISAVHGSHKFV